MEFQTPPSTARRNPPRRAKLLAAASTTSHKNRYASKLLVPLEEQPPLLLSSDNPISYPTEPLNKNDAIQPHYTQAGEENAAKQPLEKIGESEEVLEGIEALPSQEGEPIHSSNIITNINNGGNNPGPKNVDVFLRIRPAKTKEVKRPAIGIPKGPQQKRKTQTAHRDEEQHICLHANGSHSVTLTPPPSLLESKRAKTEVYTGFSHVFLPESSQEDVYEIIMHPLIEDFVEGKSCLLVAMGPTSSGKTHTMFGSFTEPGLIPRALKKLLASDTNTDSRISRCYFISMFEIYSERGRGEKIIDLLQCGAELSIQQSNIKGLLEVAIASVEEAESLLIKGTEKRTTAATNANSQSSRSQCIINVRSSPKVADGERKEGKMDEAVLTIVDLAGAEREKKTGNQGVRFNESNFINNTSMVFGLCLRALLEHQKHPKRALEKHYHNSLLTRYLKDYLEAKRRMVMVLNVSPGEDDYVDTSFVLRQASPYVNIKFNTPSEELLNFARPKRSSSILPTVLLPKQKKLRHSKEVSFKHGKGVSNHQGLVRRTIEDKTNVEDSIDFGKDRNCSASLSSIHAHDQGEEQRHISESSSALIFSKEQLKEIILTTEGKVNMEDSVDFVKDKKSLGNLSAVHDTDQGKDQRCIVESYRVLTFTEENDKERILTVEDKVNMEDSMAFGKDTNSSHNLPSIHAPGQGEQQAHIRESSSVLIFTEEQLKERISFEVERALHQEGKEGQQRLMAVYEKALSNVLDNHEIKVKMMEEHSQELELELKKEREHTLELSNEVNILKEHCASLKHENEKLQMSQKSRNIIMCTELEHENATPFYVSQDVGFQSDVEDEAVISGDYNSNPPMVVNGEAQSISTGSHACITGSEEEAACTVSENSEIAEVNCKSFCSLDDKSGCANGDGLGAVQTVALDGEKITQPCKDKAYLPGLLEDYYNQNNPAHNRDDVIEKNEVNTLWASLTKEKQTCVSGESNGVLKEHGGNLLQTNEKENIDTVSGTNTLVKFSVDLAEGTEIGTIQNRIKIETCESLTVEEQSCTSGEAIRVLKEDVDNLLQTYEKENMDALGKFSVDLVEGDEIGKSQNINEIQRQENHNCLSGESSNALKAEESSLGGMKEQGSEISVNAQCGSAIRANGLGISEIEPESGVLRVKLSQAPDQEGKSNLKKGRLLASLLNRKVDDGMGDINTNAIESLDESKATSESYTMSENDVGPIGQCLEELLGLSPSEIENGLWKGDIECKCKISELIERHGGVLDLNSFKKGYSQQRALCLRYCFSLICNKISNDKQWVPLSECVNPKSRQKIFWAIVMAHSVGKAAAHAQQGLQQEGLFKCINHCCPSPGGLIEAQSSQTDSGNSYQTNFLLKDLPLDPENLSVGDAQSLECNKENLCLSTKSPRRKLLPAPSMLLKGIDDGTVEDEMTKVIDRSFRKNSSAERVVGTRGRISLARLLSNKR